MGALFTAKVFSNGKSATETAPEPLSNLPAVVEADRVLVVENAKDAQAARVKYGLMATINPRSDDECRDDDSEWLTGKAVIIVGDTQHAEQFAKSCYGKARSVAIARLPEGIKDLSHYAELGFSRAALLQILDQAPPWKPSNSKSAVGRGRARD